MTSKKSSPKNKATSALGEQTFRLTFEGPSAITLLVDSQTGDILDANQAAIDFYGRPKSELLGVSIHEIDSQLPETTDEQRSVFPRQAPDEKKRRIVEIHSSLVASQARQAFFSIIRDITERKQTEKRLLENEAQLRVLFEQMAVGVARIETRTGKFIQINQKYCNIVGYSREEMEARDFQSITHPLDLQSDLDNMQRLISGEIRDFTMEKRYIHKNGSLVWVELTVSPMWIVGAKPDFHIAIVRDITARKQAEEKTLLQNAALEAAANAIVITDKDGAIQWVNSAWVKLTGYTKEEAVGQNPRIIKSGKHDAAFYKNMWDTILTGEVWHGEVENKRKNGSLYFEEETITPMFDEQGNIKHFIAIKLDITKRRQMEAHLRLAKEELQAAFEHEQQLARIDALTGVNNRRYLYKLAEHEFDVAMRYQQPLSVIMFDLDHFKNINDAFGHAIGDRMLERVAQVARAQLRDADLIGRYGGEEFVVLLPVTNAQQAYLLAERIRAGAAEIRIETGDGSSATATLSIGIAEALRAPQDKSVEDAIRRADEAMYAAKKAGRNRSVIFTQH